MKARSQGWGGGMGRKGIQLYLNNNKNFKKKKARSQIHICISIFIATLFTITKNTEATKVFIVGWINQMWYIHVKEYFSAFKKEEIMTHATT